MAINDAFSQHSDTLADTSSLTVDGSSSGTGAVDVREISASGSAEIYWEKDPDDDSTFEVSIQIDSLSGSFHSQENRILVSQSENVRLRVKNTSGGTIDVLVTGFEVND